MDINWAFKTGKLETRSARVLETIDKIRGELDLLCRYYNMDKNCLFCSSKDELNCRLPSPTKSTNHRLAEQEKLKVTAPN